jgi:Fe-S cluster assembly protein SufD
MTTSTAISTRDSYLSQLLATIAPTPATIDWLTALRAQATGFLQEETIPSSRDEEWRFTSLNGLLAQPFAAPGAAPEIDLAALDLLDLPQRWVTIDGIAAPHLSQVTRQPGLFVGSLEEAIAKKLPIGDYLGKQPGGEEVFTAINSSGFADVTVVWIKSEIADTIHLLHLSSGGDTVNQPRVLIVAEKHSKAMIVEEYASLNDSRHFTNGVTEIWVAENAQIEHVRLASENSTAFHIAKTAVSQARDSQYHGYAVSSGGQFTRHHWEVFQTGAQTSTTLNGLALIAGQQVADTHSKIALNHPHGQTNQLHKCVVTGKAHAIFSGKVLVPQGAQQTNAAQLSRTLLLSPNAKVDTKPQLEITADDVKCSHGATVSQLSDDELFYLQSRGLDLELSRTLLVNAFAIEVIDTIPVPAVRTRLTKTVQSFQP